jgi:peptidoglycan hydrolase-like protein with peptidoglycan-binding domain
MTKLLQVGQSTAGELHDRFGHIACTLGGVNYESRGSKGVLRGSAARGANNPLFREHFFLLLPDAEAAAAKKFADSCVGKRYILGGVPANNRGTDCSGLVSGIFCAAKGRRLERLFCTATWRDVRKHLGFSEGLGNGGIQGKRAGIGVLDRPYPGGIFEVGSPVSDHVRFIQVRLNFAGVAHPPLQGTGQYGPRTKATVDEFQRRHGLKVDGQVGRDTWAALNRVR